jgi:hypothetical protein
LLDDPPVVVVLVDIDVEDQRRRLLLPIAPDVAKAPTIITLSSPPATTAAAMATQHPAHGKDDLSHEIRL